MLIKTDHVELEFHDDFATGLNLGMLCKMKPLIIYHANCADGFGAAYAAWKEFGDQAEYFPMNYGDWPKLFEGYPQGSSKVDGRDVYILDFSFPTPQMTVILASAESVTWRDHHKTAFEEHCGKDYLTPERQVFEQHELRLFKGAAVNFLLDNTKSGCILAWEYFHPNKPIPMMLQHIGDRDIWKFALPDTKAFCEGMVTVPHEFAHWDTLANDPDCYDHILNSGKVLVEALESRVSSFSSDKKLKDIVLYSKVHPFGDASDEPGAFLLYGLATNCMSDISETGNAIAKKSGTFSLTFFINDTDVVCSLRSIGNYDVSVIAKNYGGGGHRNAAGFKMPIETFFDEVWV